MFDFQLLISALLDALLPLLFGLGGAFVNLLLGLFGGGA